MILGLDFIFVTSSIGAPSSIDPLSVPGFIPYLQDRQHISVEAPIITTFCLYWSYLTHASYYPLSKVKYYVSSIYAIKIVNQI